MFESYRSHSIRRKLNNKQGPRPVALTPDLPVHGLDIFLTMTSQTGGVFSAGGFRAQAGKLAE